MSFPIGLGGALYCNPDHHPPAALPMQHCFPLSIPNHDTQNMTPFVPAFFVTPFPIEKKSDSGPLAKALEQILILGSYLRATTSLRAKMASAETTCVNTADNTGSLRCRTIAQIFAIHIGSLKLDFISFLLNKRKMVLSQQTQNINLLNQGVACCKDLLHRSDGLIREMSHYATRIDDPKLIADASGWIASLTNRLTIEQQSIQERLQAFSSLAPPPAPSIPATQWSADSFPQGAAPQVAQFPFPPPPAPPPPQSPPLEHLGSVPSPAQPAAPQDEQSDFSALFDLESLAPPQVGRFHVPPPPPLPPALPSPPRHLLVPSGLAQPPVQHGVPQRPDFDFSALLGQSGSATSLSESAGRAKKKAAKRAVEEERELTVAREPKRSAPQCLSLEQWQQVEDLYESLKDGTNLFSWDLMKKSLGPDFAHLDSFRLGKAFARRREIRRKRDAKRGQLPTPASPSISSPPVSDHSEPAPPLSRHAPPESGFFEQNDLTLSQAGQPKLPLTPLSPPRHHPAYSEPAPLPAQPAPPEQELGFLDPLDPTNFFPPHPPAPLSPLGDLLAGSTGGEEQMAPPLPEPAPPTTSGGNVSPPAKEEEPERSEEPKAKREPYQRLTPEEWERVGLLYQKYNNANNGKGVWKFIIKNLGPEYAHLDPRRLSRTFRERKTRKEP